MNFIFILNSLSISSGKSREIHSNDVNIDSARTKSVFEQMQLISNKKNGNTKFTWYLFL